MFRTFCSLTKLAFFVKSRIFVKSRNFRQNTNTDQFCVQFSKKKSTAKKTTQAGNYL